MLSPYTFPKQKSIANGRQELTWKNGCGKTARILVKEGRSQDTVEGRNEDPEPRRTTTNQNEARNEIDGEYLATTFISNGDLKRPQCQKSPHKIQDNTTTKVRPTVSVTKKNTDVNVTTMFNPDVTELTFTTKNDGTELSCSETENGVLLVSREQDSMPSPR